MKKIKLNLAQVQKQKLIKTTLQARKSNQHASCHSCQDRRHSCKGRSPLTKGFALMTASDITLCYN